MEKKIVQQVSYTHYSRSAGRRSYLQSLHHPLILASTPSGMPLGGSHNVSMEILNGTDESLDAPDFMAGSGSLAEVLDVSAVMERSRGI